MSQTKLKTVFLGTPDFSVPTLDMLANSPMIDLKWAITMPDRPAGRGKQLQSPAVAVYAKENRVPLFQSENINKEDEFLTKLETEKIDLIVVLAFAQFLGKRVLELPKTGCFNIHTSILPKYRGAAPIQYAILNGDSSTGVSIQKMVKKMDAGDLVHFDRIDILPEETGGSLYTKLKYQAALSCEQFLIAAQNQNLEFTPQDESQVSFAPVLKKTDGLLDFENQTQTEILNRVRALYPWPGTYCFLDKKRLKIIEAQPSEAQLNPGETKAHLGQMLVGCKQGSLRLSKVQLEGKKITSDTDILRGLKEQFSLSTQPKDRS